MNQSSPSCCHFCHRQFKSDQAVKAHLKYCPKRPPKTPAHSPSNQKEGFHRPSQNSGTTHQNNDENPPPSQEPHPFTANAYPELFAMLKNQDGPLNASPIHERRRALVQAVKKVVVDEYFSPTGTVTSTMRVEVKQAIEKQLLDLPLEEWPFSEIRERAEALREHVYLPSFESQEQGKRVVQERESAERARHLREAEAQATHTRRKGEWLEDALIRTREMCEARGIRNRDRIGILADVTSRLDKSVTGKEPERKAQKRIAVTVSERFAAYDERCEAQRNRKRQETKKAWIALGVMLAPVGVELAKPHLPKLRDYVQTKWGLTWPFHENPQPSGSDSGPSHPTDLSAGAEESPSPSSSAEPFSKEATRTRRSTAQSQSSGAPSGYNPFPRNEPPTW